MSKITHSLFGNKYRILLTCITVLVGLYALAGFLIVPWLARPRIVEAVAELTGRDTRLDALKVNPFTLSGTLEGFELTDLDSEPLISFSRAHANFQVLSLLLDGHYHFKKLELSEPYFRFQIEQNGDFNIADILNQITEMKDPESGPDPDKEPKHVKVDVLTVSSGSLSITDHSKTAQFTTTIAPVNFDIQGFHTSGESDAPYSFSATSEAGEVLTWTGYVALEPVRSEGEFQLTGLSLPKYEPFYDVFLRTDVLGGTVGLSGSYSYKSGTSKTMQLNDGSFSMENIQIVNGADQSPVLALESGSISGIALDAVARSMEVASIEMTQGALHAKLLPNGNVDLLELVHPEVLEKKAEDTFPETEPEDAPEFHYLIHSIKLDDFSVGFIDQTLAPPASFSLQQAALDLSNLASESGSRAAIKMSTSLDSGGSLNLDGEFSLAPLQADVNVMIESVRLDAGNPYISQFADLQLANGLLSISGTASVGMQNETLTGNFSGMMEIAEIDVVDSLEGKQLATLSRLALEGIKVDLAPMAVSIDNIAIVDPHASLAIDPNGEINISRALRIESQPEVGEIADIEVPEDTAEPGVSAAEPVLPFPVSIGSITLENAGAVMNDQSISPAVNLGLESLSGTISGLSSEQLARADLDLSGSLVGGTSLSFKGKINPLIADRYSDMEMSFKDFNLTTVSPYAGKYAGYALSKGKLSFDLKYRISHSELEGENVMIIDQLTLGEKVESEDALSLPIPLAVSLMQDSEGIIEIDVPVSGNLNDPEFGLGRVISRAIINIITKVITSPFSMLGGLVPGGEDVDLSMVDFSPGLADLSGDAVRKLEILAIALNERPNLKLDLVGAAGGRTDVNALKLAGLENNLKSLHWQELLQQGQPAISMEDVELSQEDRSRLIRLSFFRAFPDEVDSTIAATPSPTSSMQPAEQAQVATTDEEPTGVGGFFRRLFGEEQAAPEQTVAEPTLEEAEQTPADTQPVAPQISVAEMEARLIDTVDVSIDDLHQLADARAEAVRVHLESTNGISAERLFVVEPEDPESVSIEAGLPKVIFKLE